MGRRSRGSTDPITKGTRITRIRFSRDADHADFTNPITTGRGLRGFTSHGTQITRIHGSDRHGTRITRIHVSRDADHADSRIRSPRDADCADSFLHAHADFTDPITTGRGLRRFIPPTGRRLPGFTDPITNGDAVPRGVILHGTSGYADSRPQLTLLPCALTEPRNPELRVAVPPSPATPEPSPPCSTAAAAVIISDFSHGAPPHAFAEPLCFG